MSERIEKIKALRENLDAMRSHAEAVESMIVMQEALLDNTVVPYIEIDDTSTVTRWNHAAEIAFGWTPEEAIGKQLTDLLIPERFHGQHKAGLALYLQTGHGPVLCKPIEMPARTKDGREVPVRLTIYVASKANGHRFAAFVVPL